MRMEAASTLPRPAPVDLARRIEWNAVSTWLLGFGLVAYLGLKGKSGYDPLVHDQVGQAVAAVRDYRKARSLNPRSLFFAQ